MLALLVSVAFAQDEPAPAPAAPVPNTPTSNAPVLDQLVGTWYAISTVDGKPVVDWACTGVPTSIELDTDFVMVAAGGNQAGGAVKSTTSTSDVLTLTTAIAACTGAKTMTLKWADSGHKQLSVTRCEGSPRTITVVRDKSSGVNVMRQCCDPSGKMVGRVLLDASCPAGSDGQKPNPLKM
jgi:hypothetical protein